MPWKQRFEWEEEKGRRIAQSICGKNEGRRISFKFKPLTVVFIKLIFTFVLLIWFFSLISMSELCIHTYFLTRLST